jgi:hypothetical protein
MMTPRFLAVMVAFLTACANRSVANGPGGGANVDGATGGVGGGVGGGGGGGGGNGDGGGAAAGGVDAAPLLDGGTSPGNPYGSDGPNGVAMVSFTVQSPGSGSFTLVGYLPSGSAACPVVVLSSGLQQPAAAYAPYGHRLATWGIIALLRDDPGVLAQTATIVGDVGYIVSSWLATQSADASSKLYGRVDTGRVALAGHSRGGQVALLAAEGALAGKVRAVFGLDPVDTTPAGGTAARTKLGSIGIPTGFIGETTDGSGASACAPATDNYAVLYAAAPAPSVAITAVGADHTQLEDPAACAFCTLCTAGTAPAATVLAYSVYYLTAFCARELLGDATVDAALGSAADSAAGLVTVVSK